MQRLMGVFVYNSFALAGAAEPVPGLRERLEILGEQWGAHIYAKNIPTSTRARSQRQASRHRRR